MSEDKIDAFLNSYDFMRLGQAIAQKNQNNAMMIVNHLQQAAAEAGLTGEFEMNLKGIRQCIMSGDVKQAEDILAVVTAKRVRMAKMRESEE